MKKIALIIAKLALSIGLIWFAFSKLDAKSAFALIGALPVYAAVFGLAMLACHFLSVAVRLHILVSATGAKVTFIRSLDTVLIGVFFSQTLISFVGGDAMRIWRIVQSNVSTGDAA